MNAAHPGGPAQVVRAPISTERETEVAAALQAGVVMAYPTETSYALGGNALSEALVSRIFALKGRTGGKTLPLLIDPAQGLERYVDASAPEARRVMEAFWPGALTLVLPASRELPPHLADSRGTVAVRWSPHPGVAQLLRLGGVPLIGTSANRSGASPGTSLDDVLATFGEGVSLGIDGGPTPGGPPTTLLDLTVRPYRILREGTVTVADVRAVVPGVVLPGLLLNPGV